MDRGDHGPHRDTDVDQHRLAELQRGFQRLRDGIGDARSVERSGMVGVAGPGDDRQGRILVAQLASQPGGKDRIIHRQDDRRDMIKLQFLDEFPS